MTIYTIGHSNRSFEHFAALLRQHGVTTLVDVRSRPYSRYVSHFTKEPLSQALVAQEFQYVFLGDKLGGKLGEQLSKVVEPVFITSGVSFISSISISFLQHPIPPART